MNCKSNQCPDMHCANPCEILHSIAMEEAAISHILNAEGEKIQKAVASDGVTIAQLLCVNESVIATIREVTSLEIVLLNKLDSICRVPCREEPSMPQFGKICVTATTCGEATPLANLWLTISSCGCYIADGYTDSYGIYQTELLPLGEYIVEVKCSQCPIKRYCVSVTAEGCNNLSVCCPAEPQPPIPPVPCQQHAVTVSGKITDRCGRPISTCVTALGKNKVTTRSDKCGNYTLCGLIVCDKFSVTAKSECDCGRDSTCIASAFSDGHQIINLRVDKC